MKRSSSSLLKIKNFEKQNLHIHLKLPSFNSSIIHTSLLPQIPFLVTIFLSSSTRKETKDHQPRKRQNLLPPPTRTYSQIVADHPCFQSFRAILHRSRVASISWNNASGPRFKFGPTYDSSNQLIVTCTRVHSLPPSLSLSLIRVHVQRERGEGNRTGEKSSSTKRRVRRRWKEGKSAIDGACDSASR